MKKLFLTLTGCACLANVPAFAQLSVGNPLYDPFSNATGSGGTSYTIGSSLAGQTSAGYAAYNPTGQGWYDIGSGSSTQPTIVSGDLSVSGLASSGGGQSVAFGGNGDSARLNLTVGAGGITSGTVYFSFAMKLSDLTGLTTGGIYWAGFNNSQGAAATAPGTIAARVMTRKATGGYNIGLQEGSSGSSFNTAWGSTVFTTSDTVFLVGSYTFNPSTGDDVSQLWIDPNASTFGDASAPTADLTSSGGADIARIASFLIFDRSTNEPAAGQLDDLRIGLDWADVTPAATPEPSTLALSALAFGGCYWLRRRK